MTVVFFLKIGQDIYVQNQRHIFECLNLAKISLSIINRAMVCKRQKFVNVNLDIYLSWFSLNCVNKCRGRKRLHVHIAPVLLFLLRFVPKVSQELHELFSGKLHQYLFISRYHLIQGGHR